jgi:hypothetical protein
MMLVDLSITKTCSIEGNSTDKAIFKSISFSELGLGKIEKGKRDKGGHL